MTQSVLWVTANDAFGGLWTLIDEPINVLWFVFNDAIVTDEAQDVKLLLMCF